MNSLKLRHQRAHLHTNPSSITASLSKSHLRQSYSTHTHLSGCKQKRKQGVSLQRNYRISINKLYDSSIFKKSQLHQQQGKDSCSTSRTTRITPTPTDSKKTITFPQNSQYSHQSSKISAVQSQIQSQIYQTYYTPSINPPALERSSRNHSHLFKRYNLNGIIKY